MMPVADRYVFFEWVKIFILVLGAVFGLQFIVEVQDSFADLLDYKATVSQIFFYYSVKTPSFLNISLPAAVLVSILYALGLLHRNNEFLAFRAAGMSVTRITRSIWFAGGALSIALWFLNASLIPWSTEESRRLWENLEYEFQAKSAAEESEVGLVFDLAFDNRKENRMWFINRYSEFTGDGYGVSVSIMDDQRRETQRVSARRGRYDTTAGHWILEDGRDSRYAPEDGEMIKTTPFDELALPELDDDPRLMLLFGKKPNKLSFLELKTITDNFSEEENPKVLDYRVQLHRLMSSAALCLIVTGLAIPFAVSGVRTNPAIGVSKSIGLFFGYYILASVLNALGQREILSPAVSAWTPPVFMIILTYILVRRVR